MSGFQAVAVWAEENLAIPAGHGLAELWSLFEAGVRGDTFNRWLGLHGLATDDLEPQMVRIYREHIPSLKPFHEVPSLLTTLHQHYRLGLVSDGYLDVQQRKLAALRLASYFDAIVFSDEWGREAWKPSTKPFEVVLERLCVTPPTSIYVADNSLKDFIGARRVGMRTVQVYRPGGEYALVDPPTPEHAPDCTINCLIELEELLD